MRPYHFGQICRWLEIAPKNIQRDLQGVCVDSRLLKPGDLFCALPGSKVDGHTFLEEVSKKGACAALVDKAYLGPDYGLELIRVDDVLESLQKLAKNLLQTYRCRVVAITGSVGKTTTKDFLTTLLAQKYRIASSPGNSNSQIGIPLSILNHTQGIEEILILEMGMTHFNQLDKLVNIAPPEVALITTTTLVHACNFDNLEEIGLAKSEIFSHPYTRIGILDRNIVNYDQLASIGSCRKLSFSLDNPKADYHMSVENSKMLVKDSQGTETLNLLAVPGKHNCHNFLAAAAVARQMGMSWQEINEGIPSLKLPERRLQIIEKKGALFVNDSYNANELSVKAALASLPAPQKGGKKIAVLGEMLELGKYSEKCHREVGKAALEYVDLMLCFGKESKPIKDIWKEAGRPAEWALERKDVVEILKKVLQPGDVVLLKGSRSKQTWLVLDEI